MLANYEQMRSTVLAHNEQAHALEKAIADVDAQDFAGDEWRAAFARLSELVQAHVEEEENDFFPHAQELIDEYESKQSLQRYEAAKKAIRQRF